MIYLKCYSLNFLLVEESLKAKLFDTLLILSFPICIDNMCEIDVLIGTIIFILSWYSEIDCVYFSFKYIMYPKSFHSHSESSCPFTHVYQCVFSCSMSFEYFLLINRVVSTRVLFNERYKSLPACVGSWSNHFSLCTFFLKREARTNSFRGKW